MPLEEIQKILNKYNEDETKIEQLMLERGLEELNESAKSLPIAKPMISPEDAKKRNKQFLKDVEIVKSNLRSKAIFSPSEMQWENICKNYRQTPALPVTTYKCHIPVYV